MLARTYRACTQDAIRLQPPADADYTIAALMALVGRVIPPQTRTFSIYNIGQTYVRIEAVARATDANLSYYMPPNTAHSFGVHPQRTNLFCVHSEGGVGDINVSFEGEIG